MKSDILKFIFMFWGYGVTLNYTAKVNNIFLTTKQKSKKLTIYYKKHAFYVLKSAFYIFRIKTILLL